MVIVLNTHREGYGTDQIPQTMTVGELIDALSNYETDTPVYFGNDIRADYNENPWWYTYGGIHEDDIYEYEEREEDDDE